MCTGRRALLIGLLPALLLMLATKGQAQKSDLSLSVRMPIQIDFQKAEITYGPYKIQNNTAFNFGVESILESGVFARVSVSAGLGYFRQRFNIKCPYDHQILNPGTDSLPIVVSTSNYDYNLLRLPIGARYFFSSTASSLSFGIEYIPAFSMSGVYNGGKPFESARYKQTKFAFYSHALTLSARVPLKTKSVNRFNIEPFIRIIHSYKGDPVLFENDDQMIVRSFDAIGVIIAYQFNIFR